MKKWVSEVVRTGITLTMGIVIGIIISIVIILNIVGCAIEPDVDITIPAPECFFEGQQMCIDNRAYICEENQIVLQFDCNAEPDELCLTSNNQAFCYTP